MLESIASFEAIDIPSRHVSDLAEQVQLSDGILLRSDMFNECLHRADTNTAFAFAWPDRNPSCVCPVAFPDGTHLADVPPAFARESKTTGLFVKMMDGAPSQAPSQREEFIEFVSTFGVSIRDKPPRVVLLQWESGAVRGFMILSEQVLALTDVPLRTDAAVRTPGPFSAALANLRVGIIGLGSLGSKIAVSLARTGVRRFVMIDGDVLQGENICRHAAGFSDVGATKVAAAKALIRDVTSIEPEIITFPGSLGAPTNPDLHGLAVTILGKTNVLIDATANPDAFGLAAMIASDNKIPLVWGEVFAGGFGGMIASAHPERDPCPRCVRSAFLAAAAELPPAPEKNATTYDGRAAEPMIATDADVTLIAAMIVNRAYDLLVRTEQNVAPVLVLGIRPGWIFDTPMQTMPVRVRPDDWSCARCWDLAENADASDATRAEALFMS